jgi:dTDP-4-dehydrorhamnose reductase
MRVLVVGGDSRIGSALTTSFRAQGYDVVATSRRADAERNGFVTLDLRRLPASMQPYRADVAFVLAAQTSIATCERNPSETRAVNVTATAELVRTLVEMGTFVCVPSTTLVFSGAQAYQQPADPVQPVTEYGRQKAEMEARVAEIAGARACIVRIGKVIADDVPLFKDWVERLQTDRSIEAFANAVMAPVSRSAVVDLFERIARMQRPGIFHFTATSDITYLDAAQQLARRLGAAPGLVHRAERPAGGETQTHTVLNCTATAEAFGIAIPEAASAIASLSPSAV